MRKLLVLLGVLLILGGILWPWAVRLPLGRLPGDLLIERPGFRLFVPFTTMLLVSLALSLVLWLLRR
ncbi:MAG TPA: DUF2905 domain-containing protein [Steroidobacteraceae bacterium]|nr:DUF2905 domain-containing protein [Steroidobacteraceae bacterium]